MKRFSLFFFIFAFSLGTTTARDATLIREWKVTSEGKIGFGDTTVQQQKLTLHNVSIMYRQEDLVDHPHFYFNGNGAFGKVESSPDLNPGQLSISLWFRAEEKAIQSQTPLLVKSHSRHGESRYQYGLFLMDTIDFPQAVIFYTSVAGQSVIAKATAVKWGNHWNHLVATYDGTVARIYFNGREIAFTKTVPAPIDACDTPLFLGACDNFSKKQNNSFKGAIASIRLYDGALDAKAVRVEYKADWPAYPDHRYVTVAETDYAKNLNAALREDGDIWGEALIAGGGATYDKIKDYLHPLFYSTGYTNETLGVHNLLFGLNGGEPPYIIPIADGSRIAADRYDSDNDLKLLVGPEGNEAFGSVLARLTPPALEEGYYPILKTTYEDAAGNHYEQESFAAPLENVEGLAAFVRLGVQQKNNPKATPHIRILRGNNSSGLTASIPLEWNGNETYWNVNSNQTTCYLIWHPNQFLNINKEHVASLYAQQKTAWKAYWDELLSKGAQFKVPEKRVMDAQRNLLIQNLILRWRYSLGSVVYHNAFYQPESSDAVATLGLYGYKDAYRDGLQYLIDQTKGAAYYVNWERGEKLTHAAHYYYLSQDKAFIERNTSKYIEFCEELLRQIKTDPNGMLEKQRQCGDIRQVSYFVWHQLIGWRGLRDMAIVWKTIGRNDLYERYYPVSKALKDAITQAIIASQTDLPDGTLFIPRMLLEETTVETPVTETRLGSYWNLCMPYAFASGFWDLQGEDMDRIIGFIRQHGSFMLGLLRFNYYPTPIGAYRENGLPGYATTGFDNVYLPDYLQLIAERDEADYLILSFYGKLAHGLTRGTFVSGEGATVGEVPGEVYRSCYGSPSSANNNAFLLPLRLMLVRESFHRDTGAPDALYLAHATPREWLEDGKSIEVANAPTCFGKVSYTITSRLVENRIDATVTLNTRNPARKTFIKVRAPKGRIIKMVLVNGVPYTRFDAAREVIDLSGLKGTVTLSISYQS